VRERVTQLWPKAIRRAGIAILKVKGESAGGTAAVGLSRMNHGWFPAQAETSFEPWSSRRTSCETRGWATCSPNGLLFAALAFAWRAAQALSLVVVLSVMGTSIAAIGLVSMLLSDRAIRYLRMRGPTALERSKSHGFTMDEQVELESIPVALHKPQLDDAKSSERAGDRPRWSLGGVLQPWHSLPAILGGAWVAILIVGAVFLG
jgi:hypothetical protein